MTEKIPIKIEAIDDRSPHLSTVIALGRAHKPTLGLLPDEGFKRHAADRQILVALTPESNCVGYLLFRSVRRDNIIAIVHLCIDPAWRGCGIAKKLVSYLSEITQEYYGIKLKCRRDYGLDRMWFKLGFVPSNEMPGRSKSGQLLTVWWLDHHHPTLFSTAAKEKLESGLSAAIDTSVFFDLHEDRGTESEESQSLLADWLQSNLNLCVTDELFYAIDRIEPTQERIRKRQLAETFTHLSCTPSAYQTALESIKAAFVDRNGSANNERSPVANGKVKETSGTYSTQMIPESGIRQLARAIAAEVPVFVTRDRQLLEISDRIYNRFKISVVTPTDLIVKLDDLRRDAEYQPVRLAGTPIEIQLIQRFQLAELSEVFHQRDRGESRDRLLHRLRHFIANPDKIKCSVVQDRDSTPVALIAYDRHKPYELEVKLLRVKPSSLAATLARYLVFRSILISAEENRQFTRINDPYLDNTAIAAIQDDAFLHVNDGGYLKANIAIAETAAQLSHRLLELAQLGSEYKFCTQIAETLTRENLTQDLKTCAEVERRLWPAKIIDADLPTFIVPIRAKWAKDLFDEDLANQNLFGSKTDLALKRELVYYRSKHAAGGLKTGAIGRILWYISFDPKYCNTGAIKACSRLEEVIVDKPGKLERQFNNLGIYELKDLLKVANDNPHKDIMALRFRDTELFAQKIDIKDLQKIVGNQLTMQTVYAISPEQFEIIYNKGTHR